MSRLTDRKLFDSIDWCSRCGGSGAESEEVERGEGNWTTIQTTCLLCKGSGKRRT
jgi:DnaJ-class molecular chaperone